MHCKGASLQSIIFRMKTPNKVVYLKCAKVALEKQRHNCISANAMLECCLLILERLWCHAKSP